MGTRSKYSQNRDWDPMRDDYNNSTYDSQYPDDDTGGAVNLDHCRLYVTNIPRGLNDEGLRSAFNKYGTLTEVFISTDPSKRYGLVSYETPGEAKLAMTKLNRTDPLRMNINIAHKKKQHDKQRDSNRGDRTNGPKERQTNNTYEVSSNSSLGKNSLLRRQNEDMANGDNDLGDSHLLDDDLTQTLDPDITLSLEQLKLEQLKLQEAQLMCKHRILLKQAEKKASAQSSATNRSILPDGRIVVRNVTDRAADRDAEGSFTAGAGDSLNSIPGLQLIGSRECVACGALADAYCARCGVTPYCSVGCQRRDWTDRHKAVCHNLARSAGRTVVEPVKNMENNQQSLSPAAPLRRPRSPAHPTLVKQDEVYANNSAQSSHKFKPGGSHVNSMPHNNKNRSPGQRGNRGGENNGRRPPLRHETVTKEDDEDWGPVKTDTDKVSKSIEPTRSPFKTANGSQEPPKAPPTIATTPHVPTPKITQPVTPTTPTQALKKTTLIKEEVKPVRGPGSLNDVTPVKKMVPKNCLIDLLTLGDTVLLSVDNTAADCRHSKSPRGFVCLTMHPKYEVDYQALCDSYIADCEATNDAFKPHPGDAFSFFNPQDEGWYRARCLTDALLALLDSSQVAPLKPDDKCRKLPDKYEKIPEFCCVITADNVKVGESLECTLQSKTAQGYKVSIKNVENGVAIGEGEISRWLPDVEYPAPTAVGKVTPAAPQLVIPEVPRPMLSNNMKVFLVEATALDHAYVRPSDTQAQQLYDSVLHDVIMYGTTAKPLSEPPMRGQVVVGKFSDDLHYRALCKRTNVKQNKYMLEYIEFGNVEISTLENIYPCPDELGLEKRPTVAAQVSLQTSATSLSENAVQYINKIKDNNVELILTLPSGDKEARSGSEVLLTVVKGNESVNKKLTEMCTPEWKKIEEKGGDVVESKCIMYSELEHLELPPNGGDIHVLDISTLSSGMLSGHHTTQAYVDRVLKDLTDNMMEYCNSELGKEPYLPKHEELCIAKCPPFDQWFRATMCEMSEGAGSAEARLVYIDYGNIETVPVAHIRKMLPEFVVGLPALACTLDIQDFPPNPTEEQLLKAIAFMNINEEGRGVLPITKCEKKDNGYYVVHAPGLLQAIKSS